MIEQHNPSVVLSKQKIVLNKDTGIKTKSRLTVKRGSSSQAEQDSEQMEMSRKEATTEQKEARAKYFPSKNSERPQSGLAP